MNGQNLYANATLNINMPDFKFAFKANEIRVNDFPLSFSRIFAMPNEDMVMDLSFTSTNSSVRGLS